MVSSGLQEGVDDEKDGLGDEDNDHIDVLGDLDEDELAELTNKMAAVCAVMSKVCHVYHAIFVIYVFMH